MATCGIFAALMCIFGPMAVPIGPIPVSLTNLILYFALYLLGTKGTTISFVVYLLLGAFGLPVFSGGAGGMGKLAGPTGGYLIGFIFMVIISGIVMKIAKQNPIATFLGMVVGTAVCYIFGTAWFCFVAKYTVAQALSVCVYPFIPFDLGKMVIAILLGSQVRKAGLLPEF